MGIKPEGFAMSADTVRLGELSAARTRTLAAFEAGLVMMWGASAGAHRTTETMGAMCRRLQRAKHRAEEALQAAFLARSMRLSLVDAVNAHALAHYDHGGWDTVIECCTDAEIYEVIGKARTTAGAVRKVSKAFGLALYAERRAEVEAEIF